MRPTLIAVVALVFVPASACHAAKGGAFRYLDKPDEWFVGDEAKRIAENILSYQADEGGWPKNIDTTAAPYRGDRTQLKPTFDNGATTDELRFLARVYKATKEQRYCDTAAKGIDYILKAQYPNGGWPQFYPPPPRGYNRYITFNDDALVRLMQFVHETYTSDLYEFVGAERRAVARQAFARGIDCILKCQVKVDGKLTVWCAQHDEKDYQPRPARTFELVSLSGAESVGVVRLLMSLEKPSPQVIEAIESAVAWFESVQLKRIRVVLEKDDKSPKGTNKVVVKDASAPPMWARFYEIGTNKPIFADRDGVAKYNLADIGYERRNGYAWLGYWPRKLLEQDYPVWKKKHK